MECNTSYKHYKDTIEEYIRAGYRFVTINDYFSRQCDGKCILIRHDIDKCPDKALDLARIESDLNIKSIYFVRVHSNYYNPYGYSAYRYLHRIRELGHRLSIHSEAFDFARIFNLDPVEMFKKELDIFRTLFKQDVSCYAPHRTHNSSTFEERQSFYDDLSRLGYHNVYEIVDDPEWKYLSDSSGTWVEGCFCQHISKWEKLLLLVHPVWWYKKHIELEGSIV
jgi:hypothetical protein